MPENPYKSPEAELEVPRGSRSGWSQVLGVLGVVGALMFVSGFISQMLANPETTVHQYATVIRPIGGWCLMS